jgi:drug/metabolite transporter (DMT)-like permease
MQSIPKPHFWQTLLAFAAIYIIWGSTFLAIRIGVQQVPPLLFAAMRFFTAGLILFVWVLIKREKLPTLRQSLSVLTLATLIFLCNYGLLFWAEKRVPSGLAAVMLAMIPAFTAIAEILILRTRRFSIPLVAALLFGIAGVGVLMNPTHKLVSDPPIDTLGAAALILSAVFWSVASALSRKLPLPPSKLMSSATQMLTGGTLLFIVSAASGQFHYFYPEKVTGAAWFSLLYLILAGSILAFSAYVWLISHQSPTKVGSYAYVNPLVAVALGYFLAHETLGPRVVIGTVLILVAVAILTLAPARLPQQATKS